MLISTLLMAVFTIGVGCVVLWLQPSRHTNQIFCLLWLTLGIWFVLVHCAVRAEHAILAGSTAHLAPWLRANAIVAAFFPSFIWWLKEAIIAGENRRTAFRRSLPVLGISVILVPLCLTDSFVRSGDDLAIPARGPTYFVYIVTLVALLLALVVDIGFTTRRQSGIRRLELQFLALTMGAACLAGTICVGIGNYLQNGAIRSASVFMFITGYALTGWAITAYRIFDARHVVLVIFQRAFLAGALVAVVLTISHSLEQITSSLTATVLALVIGSGILLWVDRKSREWLRFGDRHLVTELRADVIELARTEANPEQLISAFEKLLCRRFGPRDAALLSERNDEYAAGTLRLQKQRAAYSTLWRMGWSTPESLERRRSNAGLEDLKAFLAAESLGAIVAIPAGSPTPSLLVALGPKRNGWPFTFPEIEHIQAIGGLMDNILVRSRLTEQAALKARTEHLAMMSRGLAHDLKNLLTPVSSFLVHTDGSYPSESVEAEVHAAALRSVRIMGEYVREAQFFADRLAPRLEETSLRQLLAAARDAMRGRGAARRVTLSSDCATETTFVADAVLVQRLVGNLVANAIDASPSGAHVTLTATQAGECVRIKVIDHGCGIPPENLTRIFEPYFTTKDVGDEVRGFGLGLTICQKIAALHQGSVTVQSEPGRGSVFTVELPLDPARPTSPTPARTSPPELQNARAS